jgi:uncharacterized protein YutE (UPF0331/DUF86 family)
MVKRELLQRKLFDLSENIAILKRLQRFSLEEFVGDPERYGSAERFLQIAIEILNDIGSHIIADENLGSVSTYADIPRALLVRGYINEASSEIWVRMIGFRNLLVHQYSILDRGVVYKVLNTGVCDLEDIASQLGELL